MENLRRNLTALMLGTLLAVGTVSQSSAHVSRSSESSVTVAHRDRQANRGHFHKAWRHGAHLFRNRPAAIGTPPMRAGTTGQGSAAWPGYVTGYCPAHFTSFMESTPDGFFYDNFGRKTPCF
jgi:hypothetical protein